MSTMQQQEITKRIASFLQREYPNQDIELTPETNLLENWFVDSLGIINMVLFLEKEFQMKINRSDINAQNFQDITSLSRYVAKKSVS